MIKQKLTKKQVKEEIVANLEDCKYTREEIIEKLIDEDLDDINQSEDDEFIYNILRDGWKGYTEWTLVELKAEFNNRFEEQI